MKKQQPCEVDIKNNKVKEGFLIKQSRFIKQWRQRWMVLTRTHLYSFQKKGVYKNPTEAIPLGTIKNIKSYYKGQYDRPNVFRIESPDIYLYLSTKFSEEKWSWMTAIQKMLNRIIYPDEKPDSLNLIRQTLKMTTAMRDSKSKNNIEIKQQHSQSEGNVQKTLKTIKLSVNRQIFNINFKPTPKRISVPIHQAKQQVKQEKNQKMAQNVKEIIIQIPVQKVIQKEKIVYVPQIRQKIVQKIVYKAEEGTQSSLENLCQLIIRSKLNNPRPFVDFIVFMITSDHSQYQQHLMSFCLRNQTKRFFSEFFLIMLNEETDEEKINSYLKYLKVCYDNSEDYLYSTDVRVLIDILLKEIELNRSQFNQFLILSLLKTISQKQWWSKTKHRRQDLKIMVKQLHAIGQPTNQVLAIEVLQKL